MEVKQQRRPYVITFCGVNGVGKSTNLAKVSFKASASIDIPFVKSIDRLYILIYKALFRISVVYSVGLFLVG